MSEAQIYFNGEEIRFACDHKTAYSFIRIIKYIELANYYDFERDGPDQIIRQSIIDKTEFLLLNLQLLRKPLVYDDQTPIYWHTTGLGLAPRLQGTCLELLSEDKVIKEAYICGSSNWLSADRTPEDKLTFQCCCFCPYCEALITAHAALEGRYFSADTHFGTQEQIIEEIGYINFICSVPFLKIPARDLILSLRKWIYTDSFLTPELIQSASVYWDLFFEIPSVIRQIENHARGIPISSDCPTVLPCDIDPNLPIRVGEALVDYP